MANVKAGHTTTLQVTLIDGQGCAFCAEWARPIVREEWEFPLTVSWNVTDERYEFVGPMGIRVEVFRENKRLALQEQWTSSQVGVMSVVCKGDSIAHILT